MAAIVDGVASLSMENKENSAENVIGLRVRDDNAFRGTIRYAGTVATSKKDPAAVWYGVEWDDATRGKHDGAVEAGGKERVASQSLGGDLAFWMHARRGESFRIYQLFPDNKTYRRSQTMTVEKSFPLGK